MGTLQPVSSNGQVGKLHLLNRNSSNESDRFVTDCLTILALTILSAGPLRLCAEGSEQRGLGSVFVRRVRQTVQASGQPATPQAHTQGHPQVSVLWEGSYPISKQESQSWSIFYNFNVSTPAQFLSLQAFSRRWDMERHLNKSKYGCPANRFSSSGEPLPPMMEPMSVSPMHPEPLEGRQVVTMTHHENGSLVTLIPASMQGATP